MRALHIFSNPHLTNGATVFEYRAAEGLFGDGIRFDYLVTQAPTPEEAARYAKLDSVVYQLPLDEKANLLLREIKVNRQYYRFFKEHPYEIVYADTENSLRAVHLLMARLAGVKVRVVHSHNTALQTTSKASRLIARAMRGLFRFSATHYFACSDMAAQWLFPKSIYKQKKYTLVKNGVRLAQFGFDPARRAEMRRELGISEETLLLGHVGRFMPQKNHAFLLESFAALLKKRPDAKLLLIGDGPLKPDMEALAAKLGIAGAVIFQGNVSDVSGYLQAMDVLPMPSLFEGLPITGIEAQAAGLPCLFSTEITQELKVSGAAHYLPLSEGPQAWASRIIELAALPRVDTSAQIVAAGYSIDHTLDFLRTFYLNHFKEARP